MKLIVDIPDEIYKKYMDDRTHVTDVLHVVRNGTQLPKHHGHLIDANKLMERFENEQDYYDKSESPLDELSIAFDNGIICAMEKLEEAPIVIEGSDSE